MNIETNVSLIQTILRNEVLFNKIDDIEEFKILKCEDYDDMNIYKCTKSLNALIDPKKYLENLAKINIRETLFDSYLKISKIKDIDSYSWIEKTIYNEKDYNIQVILKKDNYIRCYSDLELDDNTFYYNWINNPFTFIK